MNFKVYDSEEAIFKEVVLKDIETLLRISERLVSSQEDNHPIPNSVLVGIKETLTDLSEFYARVSSEIKVDRI